MGHDSAAPALPEPWSRRRALTAFGYMSVPLLAGLFLPGLAAAAIFVLLTAGMLAGRVWPQLDRSRAVGFGAGAMLLVWAIPFEDMIVLVVPLCSTDLVGVLVPALASTLVYAGIGYAAVVLGRPLLWLLASLAVPLTHTVTTSLLISWGLAGEIIC